MIPPKSPAAIVVACLAALASPVLAHDGPHGGGDDTAKFNAADADTSGSLTPPEFAFTFHPFTPRGQINRAFKKSDANDDGSLSLEEWLEYREGTFEHQETLKFEAADTDDSGSLTLEEFAPTQPDNKPFIKTRSAFLGADHDEDDLVSLEEWLEHREGKSLGSHGVSLGKFSLADLDASDSLTLDEFAGTYPPSVKPAVLFKKFSKLDRNDDDLLTRDEWNPGKHPGT